MTGMGYRTLKTAVGAGLAIWLADLFQLQFSTFAGIIVIMCIERTRKRSLETIKGKFFSCLLSLLLGGLFLEVFGYNPLFFQFLFYYLFLCWSNFIFKVALSQVWSFSSISMH
ncbi:putative membrane protein [Caldibacillus thermoamylovorans]|uniref:Putative membrane protein n=1 Tax=Caldibacillus thermoamylovorans TaxID=35841 RepID=A0A090ISU9_9BACI|nr:aromatic acid exporter family protein [Caldibacillus thermoamylovorans]CEE00752.1 putative membrane protein [Caldibacillus thermoamylovorans]